MPLAGVPRGPTKGDAVVERAVVADLGGLTDHDSHAVIDEYPATDGSPRMDLDTRQPASPVRQPASQPTGTHFPQGVGHRAMPDEGVQARIAGQDLPGGAGGRIALE